MKRILPVIITMVMILSGCQSRYERACMMAMKYLNEKDYEKALLYYNEAIEIDGTKYDAYLGRAEVYVSMGETEAALLNLEYAMHNGLDKSEIPEEILQEVSADTTEDDTEETGISLIAGIEDLEISSGVTAVFRDLSTGTVEVSDRHRTDTGIVINETTSYEITTPITQKDIDNGETVTAVAVENPKEAYKEISQQEQVITEEGEESSDGSSGIVVEEGEESSDDFVEIDEPAS